MLQNPNLTQNTKVIFLDWNKTLSYSLFWGHLSDSSHSNNYIVDPVIDWLFNKNQKIIDDWMRGKYSAEEICTMISNETKIDYKIIFDELVASCQNMEFCDPTITSLLHSIKLKGIKVVVATDNMDTFRRFTVPSLKLESLFDDLLISSEIGAMKGDYDGNNSAFFQTYMEKNGLSFSETILLDDCANKMDICRSIGLPYININSPEQIVEVLQEFAK